MRIGYNWPGIGWVLGYVSDINCDKRFCAGSNVMNFIITFDGEENTTRCYLTPEGYGESPAEDAWVLFVPVS